MPNCLLNIEEKLKHLIEVLPLADSIILATAKVEDVNVLYTIDTDFYNVKGVKVMASGMELLEWIKKFETTDKRRF